MSPIYNYECECGRKFIAIKKINARKHEICDCGLRAKQVLSIPAKPVIICQPYWDSGIGAKITSPKQRKRLLREKGLEESGSNTSDKGRW